MGETVRYDNSNIAIFAKLTRDYNSIHDPRVMREADSLCIVEGMLNLSHSLALAQNYLQEGANFIEFYFNGFVLSGEQVRFDLKDVTKDDALEVRVTALSGLGDDLLTTITKGKGDEADITYSSRLLHLPDDKGYIDKHIPPIDSHESSTRAYRLNTDFYDLYCMLLDHEHSDQLKLFYAITLSSNALLESTKQPTTATEQKIHGMLYPESETHYPVYTALRIHLPNETPSIDIDAEFDLTSRFRIDDKRTFTSDVTCSQNGELIYRASSNATIMPDRLLLRTVRKRISKLKEAGLID